MPFTAFVQRLTPLAAVLTLAAASANAQDQAVADNPLVDPESVAAVIAMGDYLRSLQSFEVQADISYDDTLDSGELVQRNEHVTVSARVPDRLHVRTTAAGRDREIFYDGTHATIFGHIVGFYAQFDAPPTIAELITTASQRFDLEIPLSDLFLWGTGDDDLTSLTSAFYVGAAQIGDQLCDQYAFEQDNVDWQVWIAQGEQKLPCKLLIIDNYNTAFPQYSATLTLTPDVQFDDSLFVFAPPENAQRIDIIEVTGN